MAHLALRRAGCDRQPYISVLLKDNGGTANGGQDTSSGQYFSINIANSQPSFTGGPNETAPSNAGPQTFANWATNISAGAPSEASQTLNFVASNDDNQMFAIQPTNYARRYAALRTCTERDRCRDRFGLPP